ncbi:MAG TPA: nucleoside phosphorylase [Clostridiaceae bacterium]|nr:nucleoside phosphorylase [Clostridiaceae bacterium]
MVLLVTALMAEAVPLIEYFKLKKDMGIHAYAVYRNSDIALIVSGVGKIRSAAALAYLCALYHVTEKDILMNIGFCGSGSRKHPLGTLLLINKITDMDTGKDYYPDVFCGRDFPKESLRCYSRAVREDDVSQGTDIFCDMESSGFIETAKKFVYAHNIVILKIISDYLEPHYLNQELLKNYIREHVPMVESIINELKHLNDSTCEFSFTEEEKKAFNDICRNLHFSSSMENMLLKEMKIAKLKGMEPLNILRPFMEIKACSKAEGKKLFEEIKQRSKLENV